MAVVVMEQKAAGENLSVIRNIQPEIVSKTRKIKVAAYCRVSKDIEEQESSIRIQMESYNQIIQEHPDWEIAGIYADKGKTGTNTKKRSEFQQMIKDAKNGKVDMILAKSTSRFARNTVDLLKVTRELREYGVGIYFEKEKINTLSLQSEMLLTVYAAFAQEESHSISENMKRGIRQRFEIGIPKWAVIYGLERTGKDEWKPKAGEAEVVAEIFELFLSGMGTEPIARYLTEKGIPSPTGGSWNQSTIGEMLKNEKYAGDCLMQKYYTSDHLNHKNVRNDQMVVNQYYKENHHTPIVPKDVYEDAVRVTLMRDSHRGIVMYPYYGRLVCPFCGKPMVKVKLPSGRNTSGWICGGDGKESLYTKRTECSPYWIKEPYLSDTVKKAILAVEPKNAPSKVREYLLKTQKALEEGRKVEFMDLKKLVKSMTFPDWDTLEVTWIWGEKSCTSYKVEGFVEYPDPTVRTIDGELRIGRKMVTSSTATAVEQNSAKVRNAILNTHIFPEMAKRFSCPPLVSSDENRPDSEPKKNKKKVKRV